MPGLGQPHGPEGGLSREQLWAAIHAERAALADDLTELTADQWATRSLCGEWTVEQVLAHLTMSASLSFPAWLRSMLGARFRADLHNQRRLAEHLGATPAETLARFRAIVTSTVAPSGHTAAWLGEVVVHGADIRQPLGITRAPAPAAVTAVAQFFASRDFAVNSRTAIKGLRVEATDGPFRTGSGPLVTGPTLALVLAMSGRASAYPELAGPGVTELAARTRAN